MSRFGSRSGPSNPGSKPPEPAPKAESLSTELSPIKRDQAPLPPPPSESDVAEVDPEVHALLTAWLAEEAKKGAWQKLKAEEAWADWKRRVDQMDLDAAEKEWAAEIGNLKHLEGQRLDCPLPKHKVFLTDALKPPLVMENLTTERKTLAHEDGHRPVRRSVPGAKSDTWAGLWPTECLGWYAKLQAASPHP